MKIRVKGFDQVLRGLQAGLDEYRAALEKGYAEAVGETASKIAVDARANLNKPNWLLSKAIRDSRLKLYEDRHVIFQAVEPEGNRAPQKGTPAAYAWYQEHGWHVSAKTVKRPRAGRTINFDRKGRRKKAVYRRQEGKKFFTKAAEANLPQLQRKIAAVNEKVQLQIKAR